VTRLRETLWTVCAGSKKLRRITRSVRLNARKLSDEIPLQILLVEDNEVNQKVALHMLQRLGYQAALASNGAEALQSIRGGRFDLVLMDVQMPGMDGLEATRRVRAEMAADLQPRIVALTASAMTGDRERFLESGMNDYLSKPIRLNDLEQLLLRLFAASQEAEGGSPEVAEATSPTIANAWVDTAQLEEISGGWDSGFASILLDFARDVPSRLAELEQAVSGQNPAQTRAIAHQLRGMAANLGCIAFATEMTWVEEVAERGELPPVDRSEVWRDLWTNTWAAVIAAADGRLELQ
jgi:CheY-like chemotaxis protein/HPt (histidine-containing phosphotransfer) domain-containing protein